MVMTIVDSKSKNKSNLYGNDHCLVIYSHDHGSTIYGHDHGSTIYGHDHGSVIYGQSGHAVVTSVTPCYMIPMYQLLDEFKHAILI